MSLKRGDQRPMGVQSLPLEELVIAVFAILVVFAIGAVARHRTVRRRWVSPYSVFRSAGARVTRTADRPFAVTAVRAVRAS